MGGQAENSGDRLPQQPFSRDRDVALSLLQATLESTADGLFVVSCDGQVLGYNQKFLHMWHLPPDLVATDADAAARFQYLAAQTTDPEGFKATVLDLFEHTPDAVVFDQLTLKDGRIFERYSQPQRLNGEITGRVWSYRDITEQYQTQEALRQSEEKFRRIVEQANDVILLLGPHGTFLYASPNLSNLSGFTPQEITDQPYSVFVHGEDLPLCDSIFRRVLTTGQKQDEIEFRTRHKAGHWIWQSASLAKSHDDRGNPVVVVVTRTIDDRKQREQALQVLMEGTASHTGQKFFRSCIKHIADLLKVDAVLIGQLQTPHNRRISTRALYVDGRLRKNFDYDLKGTPCGQVIQSKAVFFSENAIARFPDDKLLTTEHLDSYLGIPLTSSNNDLIGLIAIFNRGELDFDPDRELFLHIFAARISAELERQQTETALLQREAKYRTIFENSQVGMGRTRLADGLILAANQRFADIVGYDSPQALINRVSTTTLYAGIGDRDRIIQTLYQQAGAHDFELQLYHRSGKRIWVLLSLEINPTEDCIEFVITDISERKQAEEALRRREADYRLLVEAANSIIIKSDIGGNVLFVNDYGQQFFGYSAEEMVGRHITETFVPEVESGGRDLTELLANIFTHPEEYAFNENENRCKDGRRVWVNWSNRPITDESGQLIGLLSIGIDVTQRRQLEDNLLQSQQFLHTFIDNLPLTVFSKNVQNDFCYELVNKDAERVMGFAAEASLGKNDYDLLPSDIADIHRQEDLEVIRQGKLLDTSKELFRPSTGEYLFIRSIKMPLYDGQGQATHLLGIGEDFTARKRAETLLSVQTQVLELIAADVSLKETLTVLIHTFEQLIHARGAFILLLDESGQQLQNGIFPNLPVDYQQALTRLEVSPTSSCCGAAAYHKVPVIVTDTLTDPLWAEARDLAHQFNLRSCWSTPILSSQDEVMGTFSMTFDRTHAPSTEDWKILGTAAHLAGIAIERKRTAAELYEAKEAAEAANRAKSQFLANMSHELRTPMNAILGFTQLMARDDRLPHHHQQSLSVINTSGKHLLDLINDVLEMSKIEAGTVTLNPAPFDLRALVQTVRSMFQMQAVEKRLALQVVVEDTVPQYILADEGKLRQVLINLLGNAIKFTSMGEVMLTVQVASWPAAADALTTEDAPVDQLKFAIADTGPGIPADVLPRLFQPFVQALHHVPGEGGSGLGLAIAQHMVQLMGGEIDVNTTVGQGATFTFALPLIVANTSERAITASGETVRHLATSQPDYRILVVDDRAENREPLMQLLQGVGFQTRPAVNGQDAVAQWQTWRPHLIWMDMRMPVMDGYEATRRIRAFEVASREGRVGSEESATGHQPSASFPLPSTPSPTTSFPVTKIIALTASAFEDQRAEMLTAGCDDFVHKPFYADEIFRKIADHLGVKFELQKTPIRAAVPMALPSPEDLQTMPREWTTTFHQAAIQADADWLRSLLLQVPETQSRLKNYLESLITQLDFETLINLMETALGD